jgi:hypothetical protein
MQRLFVSGVALLALTGAASAAELTGYITYIAPDQNMFIVDNSSRFTAGPGLDKAAVKFGARVEVTYEGAGEELTASAVTAVPIVPAAGGAAEAPVAGAAAGEPPAAAGGGAAAGAGGAAGGAAAGGAAAGVAPGVPAAPAPAAPAP